jgi:hypothetical protein
MPTTLVMETAVEEHVQDPWVEELCPSPLVEEPVHEPAG